METPILEQPEATPQISAPKLKKGLSWKNLILICLIIITVASIVSIFLYYRNELAPNLVGNRKAWKAVFLTNGQVYFGKIIKETKNILILREIYYLQVQQLAQEQQGQEANQQPQFTLIKLGEEIHGPTDELRINRNHVIFVETLKPNSKVVQTIEAQKK